MLFVLFVKVDGKTAFFRGFCGDDLRELGANPQNSAANL